MFERLVEIADCDTVKTNPRADFLLREFVDFADCVDLNLPDTGCFFYSS